MVSVTWTSFLACAFCHEWPGGHGSQESGHQAAHNCDLIEAWPEQLTLLAISAPVSVLGAVLFVTGTVRRQTSARVLEVIEMQRAEKRARQKKA
ncbi:hypothetical protein [Streptomyces sp. CB00316]|uniref:hypothetical protein n=1 Tax=Streptomyces sp. CB00316 TaxID=1703932 RepID=UPI001F3043BF|nr:hypothetical protein [Streptomyces sp. CB00316]